jgi:putative addiction module component (TIGR02574 family)
MPTSVKVFSLASITKVPLSLRERVRVRAFRSPLSVQERVRVRAVATGARYSIIFSHRAKGGRIGEGRIGECRTGNRAQTHKPGRSSLEWQLGRPVQWRAGQDLFFFRAAPELGEVNTVTGDSKMDSTTQRLFDTVLSLPDGDRLELVEALIASLRPGDQPPFDDAWRAVIQRRSAELRSGEATPVPWEQVKRTAREHSGG